MHISALSVALIAALGLGPSMAQAQYDETRIRQSSQNLLVEGRIGQPLLFTVTGFLSDTISVQLGTGGTFASCTLSSLRSSPYVYEVVNNSGGQVSLRFCFPNPQAVFNGGTVSISRGGTLIDRDRIVLR